MTVLTCAAHTGAPAIWWALIRTAWHDMTHHTCYLGLFKCVILSPLGKNRGAFGAQAAAARQPTAALCQARPCSGCSTQPSCTHKQATSNASRSACSVTYAHLGTLLHSTMITHVRESAAPLVPSSARAVHTLDSSTMHGPTRPPATSMCPL